MKKILSIGLCALLGAIMLAGCDVNSTVSTTTAAATEAATEAAADSGSAGEAPAETEAAAPAQDVQLSFGGSSTGGVMYYLAGAFSDTITPLVDGVNITNVTTGAAVDNAIKTATGELDLAITYGALLFEASTQSGNFEGNTDTENIQGVAKCYDSDFYFVSFAEDNITTLSDLNGKTIACGNAGSGTQYVADIVLDTFGIDCDREYISFSDGATAMKEGRVDVVCQSGSPSGALTELAATENIVIIPFSEDEIATLIDACPWFFSGYMSKDTYNGMTEDVLLPNFTVYVIVNAGVSEDVMYRIMEAVYSDGVLDQLTAGHANWAQFCEDTETIEALGVAVHPGVKSFYEDHPEFCSE